MISKTTPYWPRMLLFALIASIAVILLARVVFVQVEYYDGYDNLNNALHLLGSASSEYYSHRPPLPVFACLPAALCRMQGWSEDAFLVVHFTFWLIAMLAFGVHAWGYRRAKLSQFSALGGVLLVAANPLTLHYSIFAVPLMPTLLMTALLFAATVFWIEQRTLKRACLIGFLVGVCSLARFQLTFAGVAFVIFFGLEAWRSKLSWRDSIIQLTCLGVIALLVWNLSVGLVEWQAGVDRPLLWAGFDLMIEFKKRAVGINSNVLVSRWFYVVCLAKSFGWLGTPLILWGMVQALIRRESLDLFALCFVAVFFTMCTAIDYHEARYLATMFTAFGYFAAVGIDSCWGFLLERKRTGLAQVLMIVFMATVVWQSWDELSSWRSRIFFRGTAKSLQKSVEKLKNTQGKTLIVWAGPLHADFVPRPPIHPYDRFHRLFHVSHKSLLYHLSRPEDDYEVLFRLKLEARAIDMPDHTIVIQVDPSSPCNYDRPPRMHPIAVSKVRKWRLGEDVKSLRQVEESGVFYVESENMRGHFEVYRRGEKSVDLVGRGGLPGRIPVTKKGDLWLLSVDRTVVAPAN